MLSAPLLRALLNVAVTALGLGALVAIVFGLLAMRSAADIQYFRLRRNRLAGAWFGIGLAAVIAAAAYVLFNLVDPITFHYFPPTPSMTPSLTATTSSTPTLTQYVTATETVTPTPYLPPVVGILFKSSVTPAGNAAFSSIMFTQSIDEQVRPLTPGRTFTNPLTAIYAVFHYNNVNRNAQYTTLWWRDGELVYYDTKVWNGPDEGFSYSLWKPADPLAWKPGNYEVQIFLGTDWKSIGRFVVTGNPFTATATATFSPTGPLSPTPSSTPSMTPSPSPSASPTSSPSPTLTRTATLTTTPRPSLTPTITPTPTLTRTTTPTYTPSKTSTPSTTPWPTLTRTSIPSATSTSTKTPSRTPTATPTATNTASPTDTPLPTNTRLPSATPSPTPRRTSTPRPSNTPRPTLLPWPAVFRHPHVPPHAIAWNVQYADADAT